MLNVYEQADRNKLKSTIIMVVFMLFVVFIGWVFARVLGYGLQALAWALVFGGGMSFASYWWSDKIILTISGARPASRKRDFNFYTVAENLAMAARLPKPKLYVIEDSAPNAFATGRDPAHAIVCVTTGLLDKLNRTELEGVIAHELSHIRNFDTRLMSIVAVLVGMITLLADWFLRARFSRRNDNEENSGSIQVIFFAIGIVLVLLSPLIAQLIQLALSRRREFLADASAVLITKYPDGLIRALQKISGDKEPLEAANKATAHLYIINPLKNYHEGIGWFANLFNTHPPVEQRIKALEGMK